MKKSPLKSIGLASLLFLMAPPSLMGQFNDSTATHSTNQLNDVTRNCNITRVGTPMSGKEHVKSSGYDYNGIHRPLSAARLAEGLIDFFNTTRKATPRANAPLTRHEHLFFVLPGRTSSDRKKGENVTFSFHPFKARDLNNENTATGSFALSHIFMRSGHEWKAEEHELICDILQNIQTKEGTPTPNIDKIFQKMVDNYIEHHSIHTIGTDIFSASPTVIEDETYFVPKPKDYGVAKIKHNSEINIEFSPDLTYRISKRKRGYTITFKKDDKIVGGLILKAPNLKQENINFKAISYNDYNALEQYGGEKLRAKYWMTHTIKQTMHRDKINSLPNNLKNKDYKKQSRDIYDNMNIMYENSVRNMHTMYTQMLLDSAIDTHKPALEIKRLTKILNVLKNPLIQNQDIPLKLLPILNNINEQNDRRFETFKNSLNTLQH